MKNILVLILSLWAVSGWAGTCPIPEPVGCPNTTINMDNNTINGATTWTGDMTFSGSDSGLTYGNMSATNNAATMSVDADLTETKITIFDTNGESNNVTVDNTTDTITINNTGVYFVQCNATVRGTAGSSQELHLRGVKNSGVSGKGKSLTNPSCLTNQPLAAPNDCPTTNIITATHSFIDGDIVYITATEFTNVTALVEYYVCEATGTTSFGLTNHIDGAGIDCDAGSGTQVTLVNDAAVAGVFYQTGTNLTNLHIHVVMPATAAGLPFPIGGLESLTTGDILEFYMHTDSATARTITVEDIFCNIIQIGG